MIAEAETTEDMKTLLAFQTAPESTKSKKAVLKKRGGNRGNPWKGKHKRPCPSCGQMFLNLKRHQSSAHKARLSIGDFDKGETVNTPLRIPVRSS